MAKKKKQTKIKIKKKKKKKAMVIIPTVLDHKIGVIEDSPKKKLKKASEHYIDNVKLFDEMIVYRDAVLEYKKKPEGKTKPRVSEYIGACILKIAERLSTKPNFAGYSYRDEMISDGIENCLMYIDNFNPAKSKNPFAYFTQIIYFAFIRRLQKEKKQSYIKMRAFENCDVKGKFRQWARDRQENDAENPYADYFKLNENDVSYWDQKAKKKQSKASKKSKTKESPLDGFLK